MSENKTLEIHVGDTRVSCHFAGRGAETVILLHGSAGTKAHWDQVRARLEGRYRVVVPDLFGYGRSGPCPGPKADLAAQAALVSALLEHCSGPVHLVGHSYGGAIALRAAFEHPRAFASLTLIEPVALHLLRDGRPADFALFREFGAVAASVAQAAAGRGGPNGMARFVDFWNGEGTWAGIRPETRTGLAAYAGKIAQDFRAAMSEPLPPAAYGLIEAPTRVLFGEASHPSGRAIAGLLADALPDAGVEMVPEAGHMIPLTHPEPLAAAIEAQLGAAAPDWPLAA